MLRQAGLGWGHDVWEWGGTCFLCCTLLHPQQPGEQPTKQQQHQAHPLSLLPFCMGREGRALPPTCCLQLSAGYHPCLIGSLSLLPNTMPALMLPLPHPTTTYACLPPCHVLNFSLCLPAPSLFPSLPACSAATILLLPSLPPSTCFSCHPTMPTSALLTYMYIPSSRLPAPHACHHHLSFHACLPSLPMLLHPPACHATPALPSHSLYHTSLPPSTLCCLPPSCTTICIFPFASFLLFLGLPALCFQTYLHENFDWEEEEERKRTKTKLGHLPIV